MAITRLDGEGGDDTSMVFQESLDNEESVDCTAPSAAAISLPNLYIPTVQLLKLAFNRLKSKESNDSSLAQVRAEITRAKMLIDVLQLNPDIVGCKSTRGRVETHFV
jgi:hypothetical protein